MMHVRIDVPPIPEYLEALADGLVQLNIALMSHAEENGVQMPPLYESGLVYRREPVGREWWESARDLRGVVKDHSGDCEDLCAYRVAELRHYDGERDARVRIIPTPRGSFHCLVQRADGTIEDPSRELLAQESERTGVPMRQLSRKFTTDERYTP